MTPSPNTAPTTTADGHIERYNFSHHAPIVRSGLTASGSVGTARTELTDRILIIGERHLRTVLAAYGTHYNGRRPHRALSLLPLRPDHPGPNLDHRQIRRQPILGGLINEYERAA